MKSSAAPTVVIIPAHNESRFIGSLLESIQRYGPQGAEVVVVDNGSTDETVEIATARGAKVVHMPSRAAPSVARNFGVAKSEEQGEILVFLDADVELTPQWRDEWGDASIALQSDPMQITGGTYDVSKNPSWIEQVWFAPMRQKKRTDLDGGNLITTRGLFQEIGGFDASLETGEDVDICARARAKGARVILNNRLRVHHEGYPKTILSFVKRERWHGTGALAGPANMLRSPVTIAALIFTTLHLIALASLLVALSGRTGYFVPLVCAASIFLLCWASVFRKFPHQRFATVLQTLFVMYIYYVGRSLSIWDAFLRAMRHRDNRNGGLRTHR